MRVVQRLKLPLCNSLYFQDLSVSGSENVATKPVSKHNHFIFLYIGNLLSPQNGPTTAKITKFLGCLVQPRLLSRAAFQIFLWPFDQNYEPRNPICWILIKNRKQHLQTFENPNVSSSQHSNHRALTNFLNSKGPQEAVSVSAPVPAVFFCVWRGTFQNTFWHFPILGQMNIKFDKGKMDWGWSDFPCMESASWKQQIWVKRWWSPCFRSMDLSVHEGSWSLCP